MPNLCQICVNHTCSAHTDSMKECEGFRPPWADLECDTCHTPTSPFRIRQVELAERTLLVCPGCIQDAVALLIDSIKEAMQTPLELAGGDQDVPPGW